MRNRSMKAKLEASASGAALMVTYMSTGVKSSAPAHVHGVVVEERACKSVSVTCTS